MDDVFGNCSSETVMEADLSKVLAYINQDIAELQFLELQLPSESQSSSQDSLPKPSPMDHQPTEVTSNMQKQYHSQKELYKISQIQAGKIHHTGSTTNLAHIVNQPSVKSLKSHVQSKSAQNEEESLFAKPIVTPRSTVARVPVITSVGKKHNEPKPQPRSVIDTVGRGGALRHTQSAVAEKCSQDESVRPRAQSTGATTHVQHQQIHYQMEYHQHNYHIQQHSNSHIDHGYVNINPNPTKLLQPVELELQTRPLSQYDNIPCTVSKGPPQSAPPILQAASAFPQISGQTHQLQSIHMPQYVNLPQSGCSTSSPSKKIMRNLEVSGSSSAPSTPRGGSGEGRGGPPRFHHSYIELWSGVKEERDSLSDSECEELKRSFQESQTSNGPSPGYVEMSSPYVKSPHISSSFNGSVLADLATKLASYAGHQPRNIFCPFCPRYFGYEKSLGSHIHKMHREELNSMVERRPGEVKIQFCPICQARFFNLSVMPKHLIDFHRASVIEILEKNNCIMSDISGIQCPFCVKKVPHGKTGEQVLLYHMQQLHLPDFEAMIKSKFQPYSGGDKGNSLKSISSTDISETMAFQPGVTSTPGLSGKLSTMSLLSKNGKRSMEALNLDATWSSHCGLKRSPMALPSCLSQELQKNKSEDNGLEKKGNEKSLPTSASKGILRNKSELNRKPSVKRELRFSVPPVTSEEVFIPESPEQSTPERSIEHQEQNYQNQMHLVQNPEAGIEKGVKRIIPIRIDSLSAADFMDLNKKAGGQRKRRRLGLGLHSRKAFKKKDKENISDKELGKLMSGATKLVDNAKKIITDGSHTGKEVVSTQHTRTFRRPKPVPVPRVPELMPPTHAGAFQVTENMQISTGQRTVEREEEFSEVSPFTNVKLYSPLRMFRCNSCRVKFCDNESLSGHIGSRHRGLLYILRPQYGCGVCSAKFYENKYLVKHCLQHHTSLLEIRSPSKHKISIYRFSHE